jgi:hypothetical protein
MRTGSENENSLQVEFDIQTHENGESRGDHTTHPIRCFTESSVVNETVAICLLAQGGEGKNWRLPLARLESVRAGISKTRSQSPFCEGL